MLFALLISLYIAVLLLLSSLTLARRYSVSLSQPKQMFKKHPKYCIFLMVFFLALVSVSAIYIFNEDISGLILQARWVTLIVGLYLVTWTDYFERKIPNIYLLILLAIRVAFWIYEIIIGREFIKLAVGTHLIGAAIGPGIMLLGILISRKGVGMGDVKMFLVIGFFVGSNQIIPSMFYTFLFSAIFGIFLLITKKATTKDSLPMAPFALLGVLAEYVSLVLGG